MQDQRGLKFSLNTSRTTEIFHEQLFHTMKINFTSLITAKGPLMKFTEPDQGDPEGLSALGTTEPFEKVIDKD